MTTTVLNNVVQSGNLYRHFKGDLYRIVKAQAHSTESNQSFVVYESCKTGESWVRPYEMFVGFVELNGAMTPRFELVQEAELKSA